MSLRSRCTPVLLLAGVLSVTACSDNSPTALADDHSAHFAAAASASASASNSGRNGAEIGTTGGWSDGKTITFHYNKPFFCATPTASGATSGCILGEEPASAPRGGKIPVLYVMVPLFPGVDPATLQCPTAGSCINHPSTIDLSPVFGPGTENALLPPHSHIVGDDDEKKQGANAGWWEIEVVGVTSPAAWNTLVQEKSLRAVRRLQASATGGLTGDIPTNLFLFFSVNKAR
ncbi:MAG TPA: hypothetical protein VE869_01960 [Gemmatimonas sp.]|nr:hypothetical protein [Gemmatimonas sp.]